MSRGNPDCTVYIWNINTQITEELLWELFLQAGPVHSVHIPCDKENGRQKSYGFVEFTTSDSAHYAVELLDGIKLFNHTLRVKIQDGATSDWTPRSKVTGERFYRDFYEKLREYKIRPRSEPRRNIRQETGNRNNSYHPPLNRSVSYPTPERFNQPFWQLPNNSPVMNNNARFSMLQTPPPYYPAYYHR